MFDRQPVLNSEGIELRPLRADDYPGLYEVAADPLLWEQRPAKNRHEEPEFRIFFDQAPASGGTLVVIDSNEDRIIGSSRFHGYDEAARAVEIGWTFLARSHWGGACNREVKHLMLKHAFRFVDAVRFLVGPDNIRSQRAVEKIGGVRAGVRPDASGRESYLYELTATAYTQ